jgi:signal transduction histidine kinase
MSTEDFIDRLAPHSRKSFALGFSVAMAVLAVTIFAGALYIRSTVRHQIASRDAEALHATTLMEQLDAEAGLDGSLDAGQIGFEAALLASRLKGVIGIRFFDKQGNFKDSFPANIQPNPLGAWAAEPLQNLRSASRFTPNMPLDQVFIYLPQFATGNVARAHILEVAVPLHLRDSTNRTGAAQFILEGQGIALEYARLDNHLAWLSAGAFIAAGLLLAVMLWPVFHRIEVLHRELAARNEGLRRANEHLALAARSSALGAVSAHLMHGLKNPLASLSQLLRTSHPPASSTAGSDTSSGDALGVARRMQSLVEETLEVLADARGEPGYNLSVAEWMHSVQERLQPAASQKQVAVEVSPAPAIQLPSRTANLARLILVNLAENAVQTSPAGTEVRINVEAENSMLRVAVSDQGPGFPEHLRQKLFLPCTSTREGGSGLGLAISRQIADHLGATLSLKVSSPAGCTFLLELPLADPSDRAISPAGARSNALQR